MTSSQHEIPNTPPFTWGSRTYIMGILNVTPDSFSGDGLLSEAQVMDAALNYARQMLVDGADILDLGGESTRPGSEPVPVEEELRRVIPILRELRQMTDATISIDTSKAAVAAAALEAGADWSTMYGVCAWIPTWPA